MHGAFKRLANPTKAASATMNLRWNLRHCRSIPQSHDWGTLRSLAEICQHVCAIDLGLATHPVRVGMLELLQRPRSRIEPAPRVATGRKPWPPVSNIFEAAGWQQAAFKLMPARSP